MNGTIFLLHRLLNYDHYFQRSMTDKEQVITIGITGLAIMLFLLIAQETMHQSYRECLKTDRVDCIRIINPNLGSTTITSDK